MVRRPDNDSGPTGEATERSTDDVESARERGRRIALDIVTGGDGTDVAAADGGLRPATVRWLKANPDASTEAALRYDRNTRPYTDDVATAELPPRGDPGAESNYQRAAAVNEARRLIREYHDLEARTE
jgi:hypothetical protein